MINFENIDKFNIHFYLQMHYLRFAYKYVFYRHVYFLGEENIPPKGQPLFVISNHQNGVMDPLGILTMFPDKRLPVFIARGDIFKKDTLAKILRFFRILPTFRTRDGGRSDILKNNITFRIAGQILERGGTMIMFPEAQHQHGRYLNTFKKGFPRICFSAEQDCNFNLNLQILPLNLHYSDYFHMGEKLLITIGKPFAINEFFELYKTEPNQAYIAMNEKARARVKELAIDIMDPELYDEYDLLRTMISTARTQDRSPRISFPDLFQEEKKVIADLDSMRENDPSKFSGIIDKTQKYLQGLKEFCLKDCFIGENISFGKLAGQTLLFIFLLPFFLFGLISNALPYFLSGVFIDKIKDPMLHASVRFISGFLFFPIFYLIFFITAWCISKSFLFALGFIVLTFITLYIFYYTKKAFVKYWQRCRYKHLKRKNFAMQNLIALKNEIMKTFN